MPSAVEQGEEYLDRQEQDEEQDKGSGCARAEADARPVNHVYRVGEDQGNAQRRERTDHQTAGRNGPPIGRMRRTARFGLAGVQGGALLANSETFGLPEARFVAS